MTRPRPPSVSVPSASTLALLAAGCALAFAWWRQDRVDAVRRAASEAWAQRVVRADEGGGADARGLEAPPVEVAHGRALLQAAWPDGALLTLGPAGPAWMVAWTAGPAEDLSEPLLEARALGVGVLLGGLVDPGEPRRSALQALGGQESLRRALAARCEACAPPPGPGLPPAAEDAVVAATVAAERLHRSAAAERDRRPPLGAVIAGLRAGGSPDDATLRTPGLAGVSALELGRAGRVDALPLLLELAATGPSASDRLAALYAARRLAPPGDWPVGVARERAAQLGWAP